MHKTRRMGSLRRSWQSAILIIGPECSISEIMPHAQLETGAVSWDVVAPRGRTARRAGNQAPLQNVITKYSLDLTH
ncbi:MAG: hypothetical protein ABJH45_16265 [Paracoccaceae bacterium]